MELLHSYIAENSRLLVKFVNDNNISRNDILNISYNTIENKYVLFYYK